jgi:uncharacterized Zn-binding protein involved in type VI secretion
MAAVTRKGDKGTGHGCFPPRASTEGSPDVFVDGIEAHRVGDSWASHGCGNCSPHSGALAQGSSSVFVNGKALGRVGDDVNCGSKVSQGSNSVFAGGSE